jgi:regulatory protein
MSNEAYIAALTMLARRELSERQVRQRLARRDHPADAIDAAIERLKAERALDDARVAGAIARTQTSIRGRGRLRVKRQIEAAGISSSIAERAVDEVFQDVDSDALLQAALERRLRGRTRGHPTGSRPSLSLLDRPGFRQRPRTRGAARSWADLKGPPLRRT